MIGCRAALFQDLDVAAALLGHADQHEEEVVASHVARTTARHQDPARREHVERQAIQAGIGPQGVVDGGAAAGEFGRIEHDAQRGQAETLHGKLRKLGISRPQSAPGRIDRKRSEALFVQGEEFTAHDRAALEKRLDG